MKLSPVKSRIAEYLNKGLSREQVAKRISKENGSGLSNATAWVTMTFNELAKNKKTVVAEKVAIKKIEITKPTYSHDPSKDIKKVEIQEKLLSYIAESNISQGIVLTLSWVKCIVESKINAKFPNLQFLSCEVDKPTFEQLENEIASRNFKFMLEPLRCKIGRIVELSARDTYSHLLLDYCGHLNSFRPEIEYALRNKIVQKNGIIWITVCSRSGKGKKGFYTRRELYELIKISGLNDYKIEFIDNYTDKGKTTMTTAMVRRIN